MQRLIIQSLALLSTITPVTLAVPTFKSLWNRDAPICNGQAAFCDRIYSNITFIGSHDSAFVGPLPTQNQDLSVTDQLNGGIRFLQAQSHSFLGSIRLCHTSCLEEDSGTVQNYLTQVKTFLDKNPTEVVTMLWTNPNKIAMSKFASIFKTVGADKYTFIPSTSPNPLSTDQWPTLGSMIDAGNRLVVFIDYGADEKSVPYLLDEFNYYWETPFDTTDPNFAQCTIDRRNKVDGDGLSSMYIVNHFLDVKLLGSNVLVPDKPSAGNTNAATGTGSVGDQSDRCAGIYGRYPNVVLVDYFGTGDPLTAQNTMNGV